MKLSISLLALAGTLLFGASPALATGPRQCDMEGTECPPLTVEPSSSPVASAEPVPAAHRAVPAAPRQSSDRLAVAAHPPVAAPAQATAPAPAPPAAVTDEPLGTAFAASQTEGHTSLPLPLLYALVGAIAAGFLWLGERIVHRY
jgi:hypothetical protein